MSVPEARKSKTGKRGPVPRFDTELRVYVTQDQYDSVATEAFREQRLISNMVRVLLKEALEARNVERAGESPA